MNMKRYEKYKPSRIEWIGEVPEHWEECRLKSLLKEKLMYGANESAETDNPDFPRYIRITDITDDGKLKDETFKSLNPISAAPYLLKKGDLLFARSGSVGRTFLFDSDIQACFAGYLIKAAFNNTVIPRYVYYFTQSGLYWSWISSINIQTTIQNIGAEKYNNMPFIRPTLEEQMVMVTYLDARCGDIDKVVATQEKRIALLNEMKQSIITQAVMRGLNPDAKMKDSGVEWIGMVPEHWEVKKLKFVSNSISKGAGITKEQVVEDGDTQCVRYGEIYTKYNHSFDSCVSATNKDLHPVLQYFGYGDILFTCTGELVEEIGKSVVYLGHERCLAGGDILVVSHNQDPSFLNYALNSYAQIQKSDGRAKLKVVHISTYDISNLLLALPPIEEQKQIADEIDRRCSSIDKQIGAVTRQIELLREYKQSLITDVVTGKVKVC